MNNRDIFESKELDMKVKLSYADICGKNNGALNGHNKINSHESSYQDLEAYNDFTEILNIANVARI